VAPHLNYTIVGTSGLSNRHFPDIYLLAMRQSLLIPLNENISYIYDFFLSNELLSLAYKVNIS